MIEISRLSLMILGELLVCSTLLSGVLLGSLIIRKRKIRKSAQHLVERIESDKAARIARLRKRLAEEYLYEGEKLEQVIHDLTQVEMRLYQNVINSYLKQDVLEFQQTDVDVENLVVAYQGLDLPTVEAVATSGTGIDGSDTTIDQLKLENQQLAEELRVTMDTVGRMLNEYAAIINGVDTGDIDGEEISKESNSQVTEKGPDETDVISVPDQPELAQVDEDDLSDDLIQIDENQSLLDIQTSDPDTGDNSMLDDLASVDIEIPEIGQEQEETDAPEAGSLEDEWAKLLAEDADATAAAEEESRTPGDDAQKSA